MLEPLPATAVANLRFPNSYNTTSNRTRVIKTPGGDLRLLHIKKRGTVPKCGDCGSKLSGVSRPRQQRFLCDVADGKRRAR